MKRYWKLTAAAVVAVSGLSVTGCTTCRNSDERLERRQLRSEERGERYRNHVDPSWPERYNHVARLETLAPFQIQAQNGAYLDQTIWNYHFEQGTDKLSPAGLERLDYLVRKRGNNENTVYLQTARDVGFDPNAPEKYTEERNKIDSKRTAAVQRYLAVQTQGGNKTFDVQLHDPADPAIPARFAANAVSGLAGQFSSSLSGGNGGGGAAQGGGQSGGGGGQSGGGQSGGGSASGGSSSGGSGGGGASSAR